MEHKYPNSSWFTASWQSNIIALNLTRCYFQTTVNCCVIVYSTFFCKQSKVEIKQKNASEMNLLGFHWDNRRYNRRYSKQYNPTARVRPLRHSALPHISPSPTDRQSWHHCGNTQRPQAPRRLLSITHTHIQWKILRTITVGKGLQKVIKPDRKTSSK